MNPLTTAKIVECYHKGMLAPHSAACRLLGTIDVKSINSEMNLIPEALMAILRRNSQRYRHGKMILLNMDTEPTKLQVAMVRDWFAEHPAAGRAIEIASVEWVSGLQEGAACPFYGP